MFTKVYCKTLLFVLFLLLVVYIVIEVFTLVEKKKNKIKIALGVMALKLVERKVEPTKMNPDRFIRL